MSDLLEPRNSQAKPLRQIQVDFKIVSGIFEGAGIAILSFDRYLSMCDRGRHTANAEIAYDFLRTRKKTPVEKVEFARNGLDKYVISLGGLPPEDDCLAGSEAVPEEGYPADGSLPAENPDGSYRFSALAIYERDQVKKISGLRKKYSDIVLWRAKKREKLPGYKIAELLIGYQDLLPLYALGYTGYLPQIIEDVTTQKHAFERLSRREKA